MTKQRDLAISAIIPMNARLETADLFMPYQNHMGTVVLGKRDEFSSLKYSNAVFPIALLEGKVIGDTQ
jgi:hypothetical protein